MAIKPRNKKFHSINTSNNYNNNNTNNDNNNITLNKRPINRNRRKSGGSTGGGFFGHFKQFTKLQLFLIAFICIGIGILTKYYFTEEKVYKANEIIRLHLDIAHRIIDQELQMRSFLLEDPTIEIVKNGLRPIQKRIASLMVQTSQYEKMKQIPGGPTNFIQSSIQELDSIIDNQLTNLTREALSSIGEMYRSLTLFFKSTNALVTQNQQTTDPNMIKFMVFENLHFVAIDDDEKEEIERLADPSSNFATIEETMDKLEHLAKMYDDLIRYGEQVAKDLGFKSIIEFFKFSQSELSDEEYDRVLPFMEKIVRQKELVEEEKKRSQKYYKVFWVLKSRTLHNIFSLLDRVKSYEQEKRAPFNDLTTMVLKDAGNLKTRIKNLQFAYAKKNMNF